MEGIIFNTIEDFNTLNDAIFAHVRQCAKDKVYRFKGSTWSNPISGTDNTFLMTGVDDARVSTFDFTGHIIETIAESNIIYFPEI